MKSSLTKIILLLFCVGVFPWACCDKERDYYTDLKSIDLKIAFHPDSATYKPFKVHLTYDAYLAKTVGFANELIATDCPINWGLGARIKVDSFSIFADREFRGIEAGKSIASACTFHSNYGYVGTAYNDIIDIVNDGYYYRDFFILCRKTDFSGDDLKIKMSFYQSDGNVISGESE